MIIIIIQDHAAYIINFIGGSQAGLGCERESRNLQDKGKCKIVNFLFRVFFFLFVSISLAYITIPQNNRKI